MIYLYLYDRKTQYDVCVESGTIKNNRLNQLIKHTLQWDCDLIRVNVMSEMS